jgi:polygalacturonase
VLRGKPILLCGVVFLALGIGRVWGAEAATSTADPITAALPVIPDKTFNLKDFGAVGDYKAMDTHAFVDAVAAIEKAGGGHLIVPAGIYKTLPFMLTNHMDLHLDPGAIIKAPDNFAEYGIPDPNIAATQPTTNRWQGRPFGAATMSDGPTTQPGGGFRGRGGSGFGRRGALISGRGLTDVAITGSGTIDGSGQNFWIWSDKAARRYPPGRTILNRPDLVNVSNVQRLHIDGVTLTNSPHSHLEPHGSDILIENIRVVAPSDAPNTDAMDPGGQRIVIRNCEIDSGDDNVAIQSGSRDILIEDLTCLHGHGISIGSGTRTGVSHVIVRRCTFDGTDNGLRIKSSRGIGGEVHDIRYSDIVMKNVRRPFDINMRYDGNANVQTDVGPRDADPDDPRQTTAIPNFHDIHITNLTVTRSPMAGRIVGIPESMPYDVTFTNVKFQTVRGFFVQDAKGITFENAQIDAAVGEPLVTMNASVTFNGSPKTGTGDSMPFYWGD